MMNGTSHQRFFIPIMQGIVVIGVFLCSTAFVWSQTGQVFQGRKVYSNNAAWGEIVVNFCDSSVTGKFIGSPGYNTTNFTWGINRPEFDGWFVGALQNGQWVGTWYDSRYQGKFSARFFSDFSRFEGQFTRDNQDAQKWVTFHGSEKAEWTTVEGRRSAVYAGIISFLLPGFGQIYNGEYEKSMLHSSIYMAGASVSGIGLIVTLVGVVQTILQPPINPVLAPSSQSGTNPQAITNTGVIMVIGGLATSVTTMVVSSVDAVVSANRINAEIDAQPPYRCFSAPSGREPRFGLELGVANATFIPQPSINLALHVPLY